MTTDAKQLSLALTAPFPADAIHWKPLSVKGNRALAAAYLDARAVMQRLDTVFGVGGWKDRYQLVNGGSVVCTLAVKIGEEWVEKTDVGSPSEQPDDGDKLKAAFSDALKRAAIKLGIGRYLYRLPRQWVDYDPQARQFIRPPSVARVGLARNQAIRVAPSPQPATPPPVKLVSSSRPFGRFTLRGRQPLPPHCIGYRSPGHTIAPRRPSRSCRAHAPGGR